MQLRFVGQVAIAVRWTRSQGVRLEEDGCYRQPRGNEDSSRTPLPMRERKDSPAKIKIELSKVLEDEGAVKRSDGLK